MSEDVLLAPGRRIHVAGHRGLAGSAIVRALSARGLADNLILRSSAECDLRDRAAVDQLFASERPEIVFLAAARVGGILANDTYPAEFLRDNLAIELNVIDAAREHGVRKLMLLGSSCIYPRLAPQPMPEDCLLTGPLEPTNEWYAIAKIAGIKMCQAYRRQYGSDFIAVMPTNLYGPHDNFDLETSHVLPALIRRFHEATQRGDTSVTIWGTGQPRREFLHVDDLADACLMLMEDWSDERIINIGVGRDISIGELASLVADVVGFTGEIDYDTTKPDGTPRKLLDVSRINELGWHASIDIRDGIEQTWKWYVEHGTDTADTAREHAV